MGKNTQIYLRVVSGFSQEIFMLVSVPVRTNFRKLLKGNEDFVFVLESGKLYRIFSCFMNRYLNYSLCILNRRRLMFCNFL